ncbi:MULTISPECIES: FadR/GntR family transcriptional regulator [Phyllobacteriaceae]|mgnify:CR=1 FL=1|jgi:GntR family transcriptional regulator, galactonate operon transcriptional repressor|uniref:GntR family transcriptional regulator n=2 Tax=Pseudomonadota TaxID=1224 RepID=A0A1C2DVT2_9HYPH|nr:MULTISPECIES: FadR/GntR family transcriptional regulator [Mesorhizobium]MBN9233966.1 FadR family transcriptional regulator [Mesorhizobium sp.]MDQ0331497.1 DNA-binding FadR family transcriptional regulator [Mesorhizobium sp. YL-MeA3-2017]OCX18864.1 GntR family transcriptional regulator [Mesorhizobium hungaricum]
MADTSQGLREKERKVQRPRVMSDTTQAIASDIFSGRYQPGTFLPTENDLGAEHGVSRTVIREALKVLAAKGLVLSRPRVGTIVCDEDNWNIIDSQVLAWHAPHALDDKLFDAILETRRAIEPLVAELAATRATLREIADLETAWEGMANAGEDIVKFSRSDITFHQTLYRASHNPIFRQIGGMIDTALKFSLEATAVISLDRRAEAVKAHQEVVEALRLRNGDAARKAANHILDLAARDLVSAKQIKNS